MATLWSATLMAMPDAAKPEGEEPKPAPVRIKKYANRRLYNTATSSYVTLDNLCHMVKEGKDFVVHDAKTGEDITRQVLTQIIVEEEGKGRNLLPVSFLRQLISFYGDNLQALVPRYLEHTMSGFARNQEQMRDYMQSTFGNLFPFGRLDEMSKQNMALFENAVKMFAPFGFDPSQMPVARPAEEGGPKAAPSAAAEVVKPSLEDLKSQLEAMQKRLEELSKASE